jgi:hypothetical protein
MQIYQRKFDEAVYSPDNYINKNIVPLIKQLADIIYDSKNHKEIEKKLNKLFASFYITFTFTKEISAFGIVGASTTNDRTQSITIYLSTNLIALRNTTAMKQFFLELKSKISHELIHRLQFIKANKDKLNLQKRITNEKEYMSDKHEIMAYAFNTVEYFRMIGLTDLDLISRLKKKDIMLNSCFFYQKYNEVFNMEDKELKLYFKYMYMYLDGQARNI